MDNLRDRVVTNFGVSAEIATKAVETSVINKLIVAAPDFVTHYSLNNWADDVWKEYRGIPVEV